jgi:hypothetical protein
MTTVDNEIKQKTSNKFNCIICNYITSKKFNYETHILSTKHNKNVNLTTNDNDFKQISSKKYNCLACNKEFNDRAGLWRHKKKCNLKDEDKGVIDSNLMVQLLKQNDEFKSLIIEQNNDFKTMLLEQNNKMIETVQEVCKNSTNIVNNTSINNSNNKAFNLNVFLNETCKDAMDINDFIDSVKLQLSDLELVGKLGFVDGISSIIIKNLKALKVNERPVHCTDLKRETMYVKEQGIWEKQEGDYKNLRKVIKRIAFKNSKNLSLYKELHPDYNDYYSKHSDHYLKLQIEAFGGSGNETIDNENKIIKKIAKEMTIDKGH